MLRVGFLIPAAVLAAPSEFAPLIQEYQQRWDPAVLYKLGVLSAEKGNIIDAQDFMRRFLADPQSQPALADSDRAEEILSRSRPDAGELAISSDKGALVLVDGMLRGALPLTMPLLLSATEHQILVRKGSRSLNASVNIEPGRRVHLRCELGPGTVVISRPPAAVVLAEFAALSAPEQRRALLTIERSLERAGMVPFQLPVALARAQELKGCLDKLPCLEELSRRNDLAWILKVRLARPDVAIQQTWEFSIDLVDPQVGDIAASRRRQVPLAANAMRSVFDVLGRLTDEVFTEGMIRPRGTLRVQTVPTEATVSSGTRILGQTPLERAFLAGPLQVNLSRKGYRTETRHIEIRADQVTELSVTLAPGRKKIAEDDKTDASFIWGRPRWRLGVGLAALGAGLASIAVGITGVVYDGSCAADPVPPMQICLHVYDSAKFGGALIGIGAGLTLGGTLLVAWPPVRKK